MKNIIKIFTAVLAGFVVTSCDVNDREDVSDIGTTDNKPVISITTADSGAAEGNSVTIMITSDKPISNDIRFQASVTGGTVSEGDYSLSSESFALSKYTTSTELTVTFAADEMPELQENIEVSVNLYGGAANDFLVHESSTKEATFTFDVDNVVDPNDLIVALEWGENASDLDMFSFDGTYGEWDVQWTADHPEIKNLIWGSDDDGTYYLGIDPYEVAPGADTFDYKWSLGQPDGSVTIIEGTFDYTNRDTVYTTGNYQGTTAYLLVQVVKTGTTFVATPL